MIEFTVAPSHSYCAATNCDVPSIAIADTSGHALAQTSSCTDVSCVTCESSACPGYACITQFIDITGGTLNWDGSYITGSSCGSAVSCVETVYAKPGKYVASMCASPGHASAPDAGPQHCVSTGPADCAQVTFDFPSSTVARAVIGG